MNNIVFLRTIGLILLITFGLGNTLGQNTNQIIKTLNEGEVLFLSSSDTVLNIYGVKTVSIDYQAITVANVGVENCLEIIRTTSLHKLFVNNVIKTEKTEIDSSSEWYNYYFFKGTGKMPDYDCVMQMNLIANNDGKSFAIIGKSDPFAFDQKGVKRLLTYEISCFIREINSEEIEISLFAKFEPLFTASDQKIKLWYPNPVLMLDGIVFLAKNIP